MTETKQTFTVSRAAEANFEPGLREYFRYRDLGMVAATNGMVRAHVLRAASPCPEGGTGAHYHDLQFQMNFVLNGWAKFWFEGQGEVVVQQGDSWLQPPGIKHELVYYSDNFENIEITMPADFTTHEV